VANYCVEGASEKFPEVKAATWSVSIVLELGRETALTSCAIPGGLEDQKQAKGYAPRTDALPADRCLGWRDRKQRLGGAEDNSPRRWMRADNPVMFAQKTLYVDN
jgi:hypothetical protein